jgi:hypothetical protein
MGFEKGDLVGKKGFVIAPKGVVGVRTQDFASPQECGVG